MSRKTAAVFTYFIMLHACNKINNELYATFITHIGRCCQVIWTVCLQTIKLATLVINILFYRNASIESPCKAPRITLYFVLHFTICKV